ncbi:hypothetical protein P9057_03655 [Gallibacterium anatis]|uniref:DUF1640 domain-containing protein n=3 Tax=Gallibacterium TaxID=155493 RepID=F4HBK0_GALAU|nr:MULTISPECIES: hypothetical protein [Gallibacterium]AEC16357.1 hypothetical protein UMN179_00320 [Gallibacterium anatis UMN179]KGQ32297.1 hypothetical protein P375_05745 [Gallibacterium genomosp. 2]KGQ40300.1 hypothetical protein JP30_08195 [Gallibacterium anatis IPDH697-78]KGQ41224.1 hypothetical protein JP35_01270 [Gallibacterium anatis]KGQ62457.1 hypothetical protein IO49_11685 [Gallibacterium anatis]
MEQTMSSIRFDKAKYIKSLRESGQSQEISEALADALDDALEQSLSPLATKQDLKLEIQALKIEMLKYIGIGLVASTTLTVTIIGILITYLTR